MVTKTKQSNQNYYETDKNRFQPNFGYQSNFQRQKAPAVSLDNHNSPNLLLDFLTKEDFRELHPFLERVSVKSDDFIYHAGDKISYLYFPETAVFSEIQILEDGKTGETGMIGREGAAGLMSVCDQEATANYTQTVVGGTALRINLYTARQQFQRNDRVRAMYLRYVSGFVRQVSQKAICGIYHSLEGRICNWLLLLEQRNESQKIPVTQEQIAHFLGARRPSVSHITKSLKNRKLINYGRGDITILDRKKLESSACSCYETFKTGF